jgi:hypothetical protein
MVEPVYVEVAVLRIGEIAILAMLPGRLALGVRFKRGRSVGGRGAGPGLVNCPEEYILFCAIFNHVDCRMQQVILDGD